MEQKPKGYHPHNNRKIRALPQRHDPCERCAATPSQNEKGDWLPIMPFHLYWQLMKRIKPPMCRIENALKAQEHYSLTACQLLGLRLVNIEVQLYLSNKEYANKLIHDEWEKDTSERGWGWMDKRFKPEWEWLHLTQKP